MESSSRTYIARTAPGIVRVYRDDGELVDSFDCPPGVSLRELLAAHRWQPTGDAPAGYGNSAIFVFSTGQADR